MTDPVTYVSGYLNAIYASGVYLHLRESLDWERRPDAPRSEYWSNDYARDYTYGHGRGQRTYSHRPWDQHVNNIRQYLQMTGHVDRPLEGCFLNMYDNGTDALGWHSDDDPSIDHAMPIAVVTLGQSRDIQYRRIGEKGQESIRTQHLEHGSLFLMHPGMQQTHVHRIPKVHVDIGPRISLTYRGLHA